jgi:hypothetical protein
MTGERLKTTLGLGVESIENQTSQAVPRMKRSVLSASLLRNSLPADILAREPDFAYGAFNMHLGLK